MPSVREILHAALAHHRAGRLAEAEAGYREVLTLDPRQPDALHLLGVVAGQQGRHADAEQLIRQALACKPATPEYHNSLGITLQHLGQLAAAIGSFESALALRPGYAEAHINLGKALVRQGQLDRAVAHLRQAHALQPRSATILQELGAACRAQGLAEEAVHWLRQALALEPDLPEAHNSLGNALEDLGRTSEAVAAFEAATRLRPDYAPPYNNLGVALGSQGKAAEAVAAFRQALALRPEYREAHSNLVFALNYDHRPSPAKVAAEHRRWAELHAEPLRHALLPHTNERNAERPLRVGYVSPDLMQHSVAFFFEPLLAAHDRSQVTVLCYAEVPAPDACTQRLQRLADGWRSTVGLSDDAAAELVRRDHIDILVDLAGHTAGNRLLLFARKPAPVQVTYLGYPNTTGLGTIDYRLTDAHADPPGVTDAFHSERLVRLPENFLCYRPPADAPPVQPPPAERHGHVTFGSFNQFAKVTPLTLATWAQVLAAVPGSRLLLKARSLADPELRAGVQARLQELGIAPERLDLAGWEPSLGHHLERYGDVDVALDPIPYHGTTTTCEALWMGVPVVTLAGASHAGRVGVSLLSGVGLSELVADTPDAYVAVAAALAADAPRRARLRGELRSRLAAAPLTDARRLARAVETAYRQMWRAWCSQAP